MDKFDIIKIKDFCAAEDTIKVKRQPADGRKYLQLICKSDQCLISRIHKDVVQHNSKKTSNRIKNGQKI